ncbi:MAG TPA: hypothetical protein DCM14_01635 [Clostridiales bacterium UBA8153]|nr:hypothetical protein [Clostridiales bacterium UBA8153]
MPLPGEVLVDKGDRVEPDTVVARIALRPGIPWVLPAARLLGIDECDLNACCLKKIGDRVKTKEVIARSTEQGLYGRKDLEAPTDGIIEDISERSGRIVLREEFGREEPPISFDCAFELKCKPKDLPKYMLRTVGQEVKRTQIIAKKGEGAAFFAICARAPISGVISEVNATTGYVTIARPFKQVTVNAYVQGTVTEVLPQRGVVVEVPAVKVNGIFGVGRETHGELKVLVDRGDQVLTKEMITEDLEGKIVIGGSFITDEALAQALTVGCRGVITGTANYLNIIKSLGVRLGVGITGQEDIGTTLILMEGFGHLAMHEEVFQALKALDGMEASINGATQIRAGAIRPEIIVAFPNHQGELAKPQHVDEEVTPGLRVRVISEPYFGATGRVAAVPREAAPVETGASVPVLEVELSGGERVIVPRANVEVF